MSSQNEEEEDKHVKKKNSLARPSWDHSKSSRVEQIFSNWIQRSGLECGPNITLDRAHIKSFDATDINIPGMIVG